MWFVRDQYVLILIEHVLCKRNASFVLQFAIIRDASSNSIRCVCVYLSSSFVYHLSFRHSSGPHLRVYVRVSFPEKFHDSFPSTRWKPLAARTDSLDDRKLCVQNRLLKKCFLAQRRKGAKRNRVSKGFSLRLCARKMFRNRDLQVRLTTFGQSQLPFLDWSSLLWLKKHLS